MRILLLAALLCLVPDRSASAQSESRVTDSVDVAAEPRGVRITNRSSQEIHRELFEQTLSARIDWMPCTIGPQCLGGISPGQSHVVPWDSISGFGRGSRQVDVFVWRLVPDTPRYRIVDMKAVTVTHPRYSGR